MHIQRTVTHLLLLSVGKGNNYPLLKQSYIFQAVSHFSIRKSAIRLINVHSGKALGNN